jgi:hypothetical protein
MSASRPSSADPIEVLTAAQRPDLWKRSRSLFETVWPEYNMHGNHTGKYFGTLYPKHARLQVLLYDASRDSIVGRGRTIPFRWDGTLDERKAKNLESNPHCILTTGCNNLDGLDVVVEGKVAKVSDKTELQSAADAYESKYGSHFTSPDGTWFGLGDSIRQSKVVLYRLAPARVLGFAKGESFSQTRWEFS